LSIGASDDPLEREADRVADQVLTQPAGRMLTPAPPRIQRAAGQQAAGQDRAPASVERVLASAGSPLAPALRQEMEQRFQYDFCQVRIHSGAAAEASARDVSANAYTVGHNVVFGAGQFAPTTHAGRRLLAHELTHVVQQGTVLRRSTAGCAQLLANPGPPVPAPVGTLVHKALLAFFMATVPGAMRIAIPGAAANPQRTGSGKTIPSEMIGGLRAGKGNPDLAALDALGTLQVAELKPANLNQLLEGETQVARYIDQGNAPDAPQQAWRRGKGIRLVSPMLESTFRAPSLSFITPTNVIEVVFRWCQSGVLAYLLRARRLPEGERAKQRSRASKKEDQDSNADQQLPQAVPHPEGLGNPGPAPTPIKPAAPAPVPGKEGGQVIPLPGRQPDLQPVPLAAKSRLERVVSFLHELIESGVTSGAQLDAAVRAFLRANPELANIVIAAGVAAIMATIAEDFATLGWGVIDDFVMLPIVARVMMLAREAAAAAAVLGSATQLARP
jgi:hypothetical protein